MLFPSAYRRVPMDKSDLILAAIEQLGRSLSGKIDALDTKIDTVRTELKADIAHLESRFDHLETEVKVESRVIHARLDEQRQTVNALIPTRIAAVGRGTDAAE